MNQVSVIRDATELQRILIEKRRQGHSIGFVPTMGALHTGHLSLIERARAENDVVVLSIFVNPTQFNNPGDFEKYPRTLESDLKLLPEGHVDFVFAPENKDLYPDDYNYAVTEREKNKVLCGATRPGHFEGVLTVIMKLLNVTQATRIYLGEKDYQQLEIIRGMTQAFFLPVEVIGCPTVRDEFGLALSSRNLRLSLNGIAKARRFAALLKSRKPIPEICEALTREDIRVDYLEDHWGRRFAAVFIEDVRLIDNVPL